MVEIAIQLELHAEDKPWWAEITTVKPCCIYYFGPFQNWVEAKNASFGYVEDLETETSQVIEVIIKRCHPDVLTIYEEED
ncbi:DUF1816 domain-containing protein [Planktothrix sp. FACHB-1355]|uniref:DUF1816 domain-containing protein n=1 Tax=Aerosakkonema funiforme FACHB-1375 TaxID=2949571 RepID=A0A926VCJ1_9CYAN|nr:DUF1816 domain-containing protein [Aerosakkonema funiforme FACHB-1375]MBD3557546.1 DUF1816 domain-containing protein [Planktothrix sp. FACHB-1355]